MTFKEAVEITPEIVNGFQTGLTALGKHKEKIAVSNTRLLEGSVDIDLTTKPLYPHENRWDYALAYDKKVYFVEVHPANTSEVDVVLKKLQWLKDWLKNKAPHISSLKADAPYYWIQSSNFAIKTSPQYRRISQAKLIPIKRLSL
ncbi:MAG: hypothetical protein LBO74_13795 [Candidatus Symbiothrix sp.]|jgi:hypothetical protein|nr:hypothetical protein [Candidatus Symbiothrix sp.]